MCMVQVHTCTCMIGARFAGRLLSSIYCNNDDFIGTKIHMHYYKVDSNKNGKLCDIYFLLAEKGHLNCRRLLKACLDAVSNVEKIVKSCKRETNKIVLQCKSTFNEGSFYMTTLTGFHQEAQKLGFCFLPLRFLGVSHLATLYSCFVLIPSMRKSEKGFSSNYENCRTTLPSCHVKVRRSSNRLKSCRWSMNLCELQ